MKPTIVFFLVLGGVVIGFALGVVSGWRKAAFQLALQENKVAMANLSFRTSDLTPQLPEYLKARVYCNVCAHYHGKQGYLLQKNWGFGPVDRAVLGPFSSSKTRTRWHGTGRVRSRTNEIAHDARLYGF